MNLAAFIFHSFFLKKQTYLFVFGGVCPKPKLTHDECQEECSKVLSHSFIYIFNDFLLEPGVWTGTPGLAYLRLRSLDINSTYAFWRCGTFSIPEGTELERRSPRLPALRFLAFYLSCFFSSVFAVLVV